MEKLNEIDIDKYIQDRYKLSSTIIGARVRPIKDGTNLRVFLPLFLVR